MNKTDVIVKSVAGTSRLVRAKFEPGMLLQHEDLEQLNSYTRDLSRLMFKSLFGCGVICGLSVKTSENGNFTVEAGMAIGCSGDPIYVPEDQTFTLNENCEPNVASPLWIVLCSTVKRYSPRTAVCADDEAPSVCTRECDGYEIRVLSKRECACGCPEPTNNERLKEYNCKCVDPNLACYKDHYNGSCGCNCGETSDCGCKCILLARLDKTGNSAKWSVEYRVRRFIRPVLMRDPLTEPQQLAQPQDAAVSNEQDHAQQATLRPEDLEQKHRFAIAELEKKLENVGTEAREVSKKLNVAKDAEVKLEGLLAVAREKDEQTIQQLERVTEESKSLRLQLDTAVAQRKQGEEQPLTMVKSNSPSGIRKSPAKVVKKNAKTPKSKAKAGKKQ